MHSSEAEYAFNKQKPTLALRLEADYKPDGWLGPLCPNNLFYDFSDAQKLDDDWSKLHAKLTEMKLISPDTGLSIGYALGRKEQIKPRLDLVYLLHRRNWVVLRIHLYIFFAISILYFLF